jgi:hypothetical protein
MGSTICSYVLGIIGIFLGFRMAHGIANSLTGISYCLLFIPVLLLGCAVFGAVGFNLGNSIGKKE